ncbi:YfcE family phosphodiesterase [Tautonia plasticadhaerens]|uniref:Phosphoesterase n=1 Tax=Tautonia plasticadhaerens TaxID=2527974 RepID=A0A518H5A5_9BACT|nr:YfcE family phosphodiesterase [Tautonia plasticadhaerens]QDV36021.1 phosphodiesterase [Tautonia plasticadhaerens]
MLIGVLSDSHDQIDRTAGAVALLAARGAESLVHCGDLTSPRAVHAVASSGLPCRYVLGNNDFDLEGIERAVEATGGLLLGWSGEFELAGRRIAVTHGHLSDEFRRLIRSMPDYLLFGHSHQRLDERDGPTRQVNPGALHRARIWTVAMLDLEADAVEFHSVR